MVLIYVNKTSSRLQYIAAFLFKELLKVPYAITTHADSFEKFDEVKINYSAEKIPGDELRIPNTGLLYEDDIHKQEITLFEVDGYKAFFKSPEAGSNDYPFDIFSAAFYLVTRYEEYLPHEKDKYGRYHHTNSLAYKENFLHLPLINFWVLQLAEVLKKQNKKMDPEPDEFEFRPTYDVDIAYSYLHKGGYRNSGGFARSLFTFKIGEVMERIQVLAGNRKDPFDNFEWLDQLHATYKLDPAYFFLVAKKNGPYDRNIDPENEGMRTLIKAAAEKYSVGLHPSWQSGDDADILKDEKETLESTSERKINKSRQHYIRFSLPVNYRTLMDIGITDEYSMGYPGSNGFRASVADSFFWFDLEKNEQSTLRLHPFCYMDSTSIFNERLSPDDAFDQMLHYYNTCKQVKGIFISILHNHLLGPDRKEWREVYEKFLKEISGKLQATSHK